MNDRISEAIQGMIKSYYSKKIKSGMIAEIRITDEMPKRKQANINYKLDMFPNEIKLYSSSMEKLIISLSQGTHLEWEYSSKFLTGIDSPFYDFTISTMRACERGLEEAGYKPE